MINKKILLAGSLVILLLIPSISALSIDKNDENCCFLGTIYGGVGWVTGGYSGAVIPFASIEIEGFRQKHCNIIGGYMFIGLPLDRTYTVIADAPGYESDSVSVTLTQDDQCEEVYIYLEKNDEKDEEQTGTSPKNFIGSIIQIIIGKINNPRIERCGSNKILVFHAEKVFLMGGTPTYEGYKSITQWIYDQEVILGIKTHNPDFRGLITKNFIFGRQKYW